MSVVEPGAGARGKTVLVTGAAGFIGSAVVTRLVAMGTGVVAVSRQPRADTPGVRWARADQHSLDSVRSVIRASRPDALFHLAAEVAGNRAIEDVLPMLEANLVGTANWLVAAAEAGVGRIVFTGTLLGEPDGTDTPVPPTPYGAAKWAAAGYARMLHALYGLPVVILRPSMVYGPGQMDHAKLIPYVTTSLLRGESPQLTSGMRRVDLVYVDDVAEAITKAGLAIGVEGLTIDIGSGELASAREIALELAAIVGGPGRPVFGAIADRPLETLKSVDPTLARSSLGWSPKVSRTEGLR